MARLPYPYYNQGYLYYDNLGTIGNTDYWKQVRNYALGQAYHDSIVDDLGFKATEVERLVATLESQAMAELEKEKRVLSNFFGVEMQMDIQSIPSIFPQYLKAINDAMGVRAIWSRVVQKINDPQEKIGRDIQFAKIFGGYLTTEIGTAIEQFEKNVYTPYMAKWTSGDKNAEKELEKQWKGALEKAFDKAWKRLLHAPDRKTGELAYIDLLDAMQKTEDFQSTFNTRFFSRFGFDKLQTELLQSIKSMRDNLGNASQETITRRLRTNIRSRYRAQLTSQQLAGEIAEEMSRLIMASAEKAPNMTSFTTASKKSNSSNTDVVFLAGELEADFIPPELPNNLGVKERERQLATAFAEHLEKNLKNGFVIYESTKAYHLGDSFDKNGGFSGTEYNLDSFKSLLKDMGIKHITRFITTIMNTANHAILSDKRESIQANMSMVLSEAIGYMLFDDFTTIGNAKGSVDALHVFRLTEIVVPLSYLLYQTAQAMRKGINEMRQYIKINFTLGQQLYPDSLYDSGSLDTSGTASINRWINQKEHNLDTFKVSISFLKNFKTELLAGLSGLI